MKGIVFGLLFVSGLGIAQEPPQFEQVAFDYFFEHIFFKEFNKKSIQFSGTVKMERSYFFSYVSSCFGDDPNNEFKLGMGEAAQREVPRQAINLATSGKNVTFKKKGSGLIMDVYRETSLDGLHYVLIMVRYKTGQSYFYFAIQDDGTIARWCKTGIVY